MKNKNLIRIICIFIYLLIIGISSHYLIMPGVNKLKEASNIKELTFDEKTKLIDEINNEHTNKINNINSKYEPKINDINKKYDDIEISIKDNYTKLISDIEDKYIKEEKRLSNEINDNKVLQNKEFFANGLSKKYYELSDKGTELFKEKSSLESKKRDEKRELERKKDDELNKNKEFKENELKSIEENKNNEIFRLNEIKQKEIDSINNRSTNKDAIKNTGIKKIIIGIIIILIPILYIVIIFNKLTILLNEVKEKWAQVDVYLKRRTDLIPNIVESVKGYSNHEKSTLTKITKARNQVINASNKEEEISANEKLESELGRLLILQEDYPELRANENFINLQHNLSEIEEDISISRSEYNNSVLKYKNKLEVFPSNIVAALFNFKPELFFEINNDEKNNVDISFE